MAERGGPPPPEWKKGLAKANAVQRKNIERRREAKRRIEEAKAALEEGRPLSEEDTRQLAKAILVKAVLAPDTHPRDLIAAARELLDRAEGRPVQKIEQQGSHEIHIVVSSEMERAQDLARRSRELPPAG